MGNRNDGYYPVNVSVDFDVQTEPKVDTKELMDFLTDFEGIGMNLKNELSQIDSISFEEEPVDESEFLSFDDLMAWEADADIENDG